MQVARRNRHHIVTHIAMLETMTVVQLVTVTATALSCYIRDSVLHDVPVVGQRRQALDAFVAAFGVHPLSSSCDLESSPDPVVQASIRSGD